MIELIDQIRTEVSCCCSWTRYEAIMGLLDQMEEKLNDNNDNGRNRRTSSESGS